jgi:hypothetical protein
MQNAAFHSETPALPIPKLRFGELGHGNPKHAYKRLMGEYLISHFGSAGRWWATGTYSDPKPPSLAELKDQLKASGVSFTEADAKDAHLKLATQFLTERSKTMEEAKSKMFGRILTSLSDEGNELVRSDHRFDEAYAKSNLTVLYRIVMAVHGAGDSNDLRYAGERARERYQTLVMRAGQSVYDFVQELAEAYENLGATGQHQPESNIRGEDLLRKLDSRFEPLRQQFRDQELLNMVRKKEASADGDEDDEDLSASSVFPDTYEKMVLVIQRYSAQKAVHQGSSTGTRAPKVPNTGAAFVTEQSALSHQRVDGAHYQQHYGRPKPIFQGRVRFRNGRDQVTRRTVPQSTYNNATAQKPPPVGDQRTQQHRGHPSQHRQGQGSQPRQGYGTPRTSTATRQPQAPHRPPEDFSFDRAAYVITGEATPDSHRVKVILDSGANTAVSSDARLLKDVKPCPPFEVKGLCGHITLDRKGTMLGIMEAYYHPEGLVNIMPFCAATKLPGAVACEGRYEIPSDRGIIKFHENNGMLMADVTDEVGNAPGEVLHTTVAQQMAKFTKRDEDGAKRARQIQERLGFPATRDLVEAIRRGTLIGVDITDADVIRAKLVFGPHPGILMGKSVRRASPVIMEITGAAEILVQTLHVDIGFDDTVPFILGAAKPLVLVLIGDAKQATSAEDVARGVDSINTLEGQRFQVRHVIIDGDTK